MWTNKQLEGIVNDTVVSVTKRLAGISLFPCDTVSDCDDASWAVLKIAITGLDENNFSFYYRAPSHVYKAIAEHMKQGEVENAEDMEIYLKEYFNILCGNIISKINRAINTSMRFGIPDYYDQGVITEQTQLMKVCYECQDAAGRISITGISDKPA